MLYSVLDQQRETTARAVLEVCMSEIPLPLQKPRRGARGRPFDKGQSGNPAGRLAGSDLTLRLCLDRILAPRRERTVRFALPPVRSAADLAAALEAITAAVAEGELTTGEAFEIGRASCRERV